MRKIAKRVLFLSLTLVMLFAIARVSFTASAETAQNPVSQLTFSSCVGYTRVWDAKHPCEGDLVIPAYHGGLPVQYIWTSALSYTNITSVVIPDTVISLASGYNFDGCRQLKSVVMSNNVSIIPNNAFSNCDVLESIDLGTGVKKIYYSAFVNCPKLEYVQLPTGIEEIRSYAFSNGFRGGLQCVYYPGSVSQWEQVDVQDTAVQNHILYETYIKSTACDVSGVTVTADARPGAASYTFYREELIGDTWIARTEVGTSEEPRFTDTTALPGQTYRYFVLAKNGPYTTRLSPAGDPITYKKLITSFKLSSTSYTYNGKVKTPKVTVKDSAGNTLEKDTDYTVSYSSGRKNVGTYKVTVTMKGDYTGTKTLTFKIKPIKISTCKVSLSATSYTYNGKVKKPKVTVKSASGTTLKEGTHYTVTYASGRKNVGTYKVTVKMKGNYSGTKTLTFKIVPKAASINKLTAAKKALTVKLNRQTTQTTGYHIQYATTKTFKDAKLSPVTSSKTATKTIKSLKAKKTYFVRVRSYKTVNGTKIYSAWSSVKSIKTK